jgi:peptidoglycan lytic transglycosylase G
MAPRRNAERTAAEREAARLERERRRAAREGRPPPEPAAVDLPPEPVPDPRPDPEPPAPEPPAPEPAADPLPPAAYERQPRDEPEPVRAYEPQPTQPLEPVGAVHARRTVSLPRPHDDDELGHHTDSWDRPIGTVRVSRAEYQAQPGAAGLPPHRKVGVPRSRRRLVRRVVPIVLLLVVLGVAYVAYLLFQPAHGKGHGAVTVRIAPGASAGEIGDLLAKQGVVDSSFFFDLRARLSGDRGKLRAGTYTLKKSMPYGDALAALTTPPSAAPTIRVTIPEGPSRRELTPRVKAAGVSGSYLKASSRSRVLSARAYGAPKGTRGLEGFLFPATYELRRSQATARKLVDEQLRTFKRELAKVDLSRARRKNLTRYDVLIIASMIEREALVAKDRRLIAAVIYNRLKDGMPLGIDATLRYRLSNWSRPLRRSELQTSSAYNTRLHKGLPPTPIGNPGLASIRAAANPANVPYRFYVVKPCGRGAHAFSATDAQFQKDVAAYNKARERNGRKDPSRC